MKLTMVCLGYLPSKEPKKGIDYERDFKKLRNNLQERLGKKNLCSFCGERGTFVFMNLQIIFTKQYFRRFSIYPLLNQRIYHFVN